MNTLFSRGMAKATALTRSGKLQAATALIQSLLHPAAPQTEHPAADTATVIDGDFTRLEPDCLPPEPANARKTPPKPARTGLGETLRKIAAARKPVAGRLAGSDRPLPEGAQVLRQTHRAAPGSRDYLLYLPARRPVGKMPLVVMLHGCTQTAEDFAAGTGMNALAEEFGCLIAYPAQPAGANPQQCWNWFRPEDQARDRGEPALIAGLTREIQRDHPADPARTYVSGLSAGGAAAVLVAAAYPDIFSAVGVHSGLPAGSASDIAQALAAMRSGTRSEPHRSVVPTIAFHGQADSTVHPKNGAAILAQALHAMHAMPDLRKTQQKGVSDGGRRYRATAHVDGDGRSFAELWEIEGAGHAWAGGDPAGSYTDPRGPDASRRMLQFFLQHSRA